ncbi:hypothetical protein DCG74_29380 [Bradyrhizobium sp. WBAH42]|nr:hypothetical protein [Bradyrhizobium sp. WBAH30]MDD1545504.1 hypothetical protein [Bradyrhizobium sp. WBAH41]MDD1554167.1 hypothetical protein [Bradyrhizobium sp. WBAH23]MDD1562118.1 hypothetical protein [Bradyrhizobium sp. WBAH33]MDD1591653.1 hypothetical protein [Bradyrhizobium sp. WBAH42]NRB85176.1 hypothetical protein [Bradyrhizobium sp. WBAH10]QCJ92211.1 hypothetical protein DAA57_29805 [Bradyrhizobium yuanmingense]
MSFRGATKSRARNPFIHHLWRSMDSGFAPRGAPRNDCDPYTCRPAKFSTATPSRSSMISAIIWRWQWVWSRS